MLAPFGELEKGKVQQSQMELCEITHELASLCRLSTKDARSLLYRWREASLRDYNDPVAAIG